MPGSHETRRLHLAPWTPSDLEAFHAIWGDPEVIFWGPSPDLATSRARLERVIEQSRGSPPGFGWFKAERGGIIVANAFLQPCRHGLGWELGYHVHRAHQGRGYATEASRALIDHALAEGEGPVVLLVLPDNAPSQRVAAKLGVAHVGSRMHADLLHDVYEARGS